MTTGVAPLTGYRHRVEDFHQGRWLVHELVSFRDDRRVSLFHDAPPEERSASRTLVSAGYALVSFVDIDWVDRRARLEMRLLDVGLSRRFDDLLTDVVRIAFERFDLVRVEGWVTPVHYDIAPALLNCGFALEACVPHAVRVDGRPVARQIWGLVCDQ